MESLTEEMPQVDRSPLEQVIDRQRLDSYEYALARLGPAQQEALILRFEFGFSYPELATALGSPSPNAARMFVTRALVQLTEVMDD
jgi:RNA polymerase sigma-70 factor (ECF subfamily)